jgi:hypothetical protein
MSAPMPMLTPSELVYFHGERFAHKTLLSNVKLVASGTPVSAQQLGQAVLAAAFLALDRAGDVSFAEGAEKFLFGLGSHRVLDVIPTARPTAWPTPSLEASLHALAAQGQARRRRPIAKVVYDLLQRDSANPWLTLLEEIVPAQLAARGWLIATEVRKLGLFVQTHYEFPLATAAQLARQSVGEAEALLDAGKRDHPETWRLLTLSIKAGLGQRVEQGGGP